MALRARWKVSRLILACYILTYVFTDPRVLQEVERVRAAKARREAKLVSEGQLDTTNLHGLNTVTPSKVVSVSSISTQSSPRVVFPARKPALITPDSNLPQEVDFSPSTGSKLRGAVPRSNDSGDTLDWSNSDTDLERTERRWALSVTKRRASDVVPTPAHLEKSAALYNGA
jgi:hypothetical protein